MKIQVFEILQNLFKFCCFATVLFMISLWIHNYMQDENLCLVDYRPLENTDDLEFPELSLCLLYDNPFIKDKFTDLNTTKRKYRKHLKGSNFNENLTKIDYNEVTINLQDYYKRTALIPKNGTHRPGYSKYGNVSIRATANDFTMSKFRKCFTIDTTNLNMDNVRFVGHIFHMDFFRRYVASKKGEIVAMVHHHNQLLLADSFRFLSPDSNGSKSMTIGILVNKVEILRRRNKPKEPCLTDVTHWDLMEVLRYTKEVGCSAPYQKPLENFETCSTEKKMKEWNNFSPVQRNNKGNQPCQVMPRADFEFTTEVGIRWPNHFILGVSYPEQVKIITQSRAVDVNALIGNIGGYIGLFLGYAVIQLPDFLLSLYKYANKIIRDRHLMTLNQNKTKMKISMPKDAMDDQRKPQKENLSIATRVSKLEEDMCDVVAQLKNITNANNNGLVIRIDQTKSRITSSKEV